MTFAIHNLLRLSRDIPALFFSVVLPVIFYLLFGAMQSYGSQPIGGGNVAAYVMLGIAFFAGVTGTVGGASSAVVEHQTGWGRQLALTPLSNRAVLLAYALQLLVRALLPVAAVFAAGALTGAVLPAPSWLVSFVVIVAVSVPFGFYGLLWALLVPSTSAISIASSSVVLLAFAGNLFMPLSESLLAIARFTPMYGPGALARWPLAHGVQSVSDGASVQPDPLWLPVCNTLVWVMIFFGACALLYRRDKQRR